MSSPDRGIVYLVGAGPGDPGLITVRGARLLEMAEVVVYDYLANPALLRHCPPEAEVIYVGKKAADHTYTQEQINALLVEKGLAGKRVVRLKGGDPFVFGRGGEEAEALVAAGVPFEVVPGITAAIAAPAYAGIPVTHRDFNSSFTLITGHEKEEQYKDEQAKQRGAAAGSSDIDWPSVARLPCVAFYMGVKALPRICQKLIEHGKPADTPAATIQWGTRPNQRTAVGTIGNLVQKIEEAGVSSPAITIIGRVVDLRQTMNWFESRPLFGQTVVVTRTRHQASELSAQLEELGARVIEAPTIEIVPPANWQEVDDALAAANQFDWVIFTSVNGVTFTRQRLRQCNHDVRIFGKARLAAVGETTARAIGRELSLHCDLCPDRFVADALYEALAEAQQVQGKRFLLLRADIGRPLLVQRLRENGAAEVRDIAVYQTRPATTLPGDLTDALDRRQVQWVTFTSSSTARNFIDLLGGPQAASARLAGVKLASIGPVTSNTLRELGFEPTLEARTFDLPGLVDALCAANAPATRDRS